jgi:uncharacterized protein (TIGR02145 family)/prepilin-type N-terminal cleavage/methylation domain-containing protein
MFKFIKKLNSNIQGFTLIEVLVAVFIIAILATGVTYYLGSSREESRDFERISDISQIKDALGLYYLDHGYYPETNSVKEGQPITSKDGKTIYLQTVPTAPIVPNPQTDISGYNYTRSENGLFYSIDYYWGGNDNSTASGGNSIPVAGTPSGGGSGTTSYTGNCKATPASDCELNTDCVAYCGDKECGDDGCGGVCGGCSGDNYCVAETCTIVACDGSGGAVPCGHVCTDGSATYSTVQFGDQCWLATNLNVGTMIAGSQKMLDDSKVEKWCYNDNEINPNPVSANIGGCDTDGGLYTWAEAMALPDACNYSKTEACAPASYLTGTGASARRQGICPQNWHIPSDKEIWTMAKIVDSSVSTISYYADQIGLAGSSWKGTDLATKWRCRTSGKPWTNCGTSNFKIPLSGNHSAAGFGYRGSSTNMWSASQYDASMAWGFNVPVGSGQVYRDFFIKGNTPGFIIGFPVRCIRD